MLDDPTLTPGCGTIAEPPPNAHRPTAAARSTWLPSLRFPPRLEISPLTIRRPSALDTEGAQVC